MKIIHLISGGDIGGAKTHVLSLLAGLNKTQDVHLVCFAEGKFSAEARQLKIPTTVISGRNPYAVRKRLIAMIRHGEFEVIHCHGARANMMGALLRKKLEVPVVSTVHSDYRLDYLGRPLGRLTYGNINKLALRRLSFWIGVSEPMAELLISRGFDPQRMFTIYNGLDFTPGTARCAREEYLRRLGISVNEATTVFGIAARINPVKDMPTLVRAFAAAVKTCPDIRLLIAGDGEQEAEVKSLAASLCPEGTVAFTGWIEDADSFYNALDVNMLTSISETFPYALTEGARWHCATIASNVGGVPKLIDDGINGFLFQPRDVQMLEKLILYMAQNPERRRQMGELLFEKASKEFSVSAMVERQLEIYRTIIRRAGRMERKRDGVFICGAYGRGNGGDDTILEAIVAQMRDIDPDIPIYALSRTPEQTKRIVRIGAVYTFDLLKSRRYMKRAKLYLSGGGTLMQDVTSTRSILFYLLNIRMAKRSGCKVMLYGCGVGPIHQPKNKKRAAKTLDRYVDVIALRDDYSLLTLNELGVTRPEIRLTADPALLCEPLNGAGCSSYLYSVGLRESERYIMFALRPWKGFQEKIGAFAAAAEYAWRCYGLVPVFFGLEPNQDMPELERTAARIHCPHLILPSSGNSKQIISLISRMDIVISMRLHALIFAAGQGVPVVGIVYDPKVSGFLDYLGQDLYLPLEEVDPGALNDLIDGAISGSVAEEDSVRHLRSLAAQNEQLAKRLLSEY